MRCAVDLYNIYPQTQPQHVRKVAGGEFVIWLSIGCQKESWNVNCCLRPIGSIVGRDGGMFNEHAESCTTQQRKQFEQYKQQLQPTFLPTMFTELNLTAILIPEFPDRGQHSDRGEEIYR